MRCEVVAVGTELLLGQIVDTNSSWIGEQLALAGIDSHFQTKVGDNPDRMIACIRLALDRADAAILCGGLGPTQDDITREAIAEVMGVALVRDPEIGAKIRHLFESRGRKMTENNLRQADVPVGATVIPQMPGTAPGLICPVGEKVIYAVPGVPFEMRMMVGETVIPDLQRRAGIGAVIKSRVLRTWGNTESGLAEMLADRIRELDETGTATIAFQASGIEGLKVRLTAKAADATAAEAVLAAEETRVREILGESVFGVDDQTMEATVLGLLKDRGLSLAVAEPLTGGLAGSRLTAVRHMDGVFRGSVVSESSIVYSKLLGLSNVTSEPIEVAKAMARGVRAALAADVGLAAVDAPGGAGEGQGRPPGAVFIGLALGAGTEVRQVNLPGDRVRVRQYAVISMLDFLRRSLAA
ncbi:MAG: CinA family nicotinamide mononucleotide deamidase-related protein [Alphaproteobacteria bacterium]|jgi:nicotinamide-nucleotide amidase|nr:CinA family nicotinamide mononucleotide deamidase-related protein [Alphaproteobacteria bacterium]MDP6515217.1 CinA family nicotinamide mononucleotide deamidase-related protein [Alphaproteobacteria bacterium]